MQFDENKHKRDKDGKFTYKNGSGKSEGKRLTELVNKYSSEPDRDIKKLELPNRSGYVKLPPKEYASLCSAIRTRYADKIPSSKSFYYGDYVYDFVYDDEEEQILFCRKVKIE